MHKQILFKPLILLTISTLLALAVFIFKNSYIKAEGPIPDIHFPCNLTANPEFSSLRPYQAAACGDANKAIFCSNSLIFTETFSDFPQCKAQAPAEGSFICDLGSGKDIPDHNLVVDLADSNLPILGNTELTKNSSSNQDQIDDATKVNEYASWYLNGTINRAEYGENDPNKIVDYAGPIQKIMPQAILEAQRIATINSASKETSQIDENGQPTNKTEFENHNQIVVCGKSNLGILGDITGLGSFKPIECYPNGDKSKAQGRIFRFKKNDSGPSDDNWDGDLSFWNNFVNNIISKIVDILPYVPREVIKESILNHWNRKTPPLPWEDDPFTGKPMTSLNYRKYYNEWRGKTCVIVPAINWLICFENILVPNRYADLFPYVPLANTVDKNGSETVQSVVIQTSNGTKITNESYGIPQNAPLWFAHTQEVKDLAEFLSKSYTPEGVNSEAVPETTENNNCQIVNVRSNPGDNLFPGQTHGIIVPNVHYTITNVPCEATTETKTNDQNQSPCGPGVPVGGTCAIKIVKCNAEVNITLPTITKTPWADEIWQTTVANSNSIFRRIYPKVGENAPVSCIADIPASTKVTYTANDSVGNGTSNFKVKDPTGVDTSETPTLMFPHIGSVYDYFLKGIQTALRPLGYADPSPESGTLCQNIQGGGDCSFNINKINQAIQKASSKYNVPAELLRAIFEIESADEIANPSIYQCKENSAHAAGVTQITKSAYEAVTCSNERLPNDIGVCSQNSGKLSRCNIDDAFELEARVLLWKVGKLNGCKPTGGISLSNKMEWYNASCNYYGSFSPDQLTINYAKGIPANERRQDGEMNYCDIVCWKLGQCSGSNYPPR